MPSFSFPLLDLPRKLRDAIYQQYVIVEGGYIYEFETGKLRAANDPEYFIDLALMYTCKQVAREMKGMALGANTITFRTLSCPELSFRASHFHGIMRTLIGAAGRLLELCDQRVLDEVARGFPECQPLLQLARVVGQEESPSLTDQDRRDILFLKLRDTMDESIFDEDCWKEVPSVIRELLFEAIDTALEFGCPLPKERSSTHPILPGDILELMSKFMPWAIPTPDEINYAIRKFDKERWTKNKTRKGKICPFSAAAVAIKFLHDTPMSTRKHIRKIIVHEDRESVAYPQCHAEGFLPFCLENSFLRIERRVNLWRAVVVGFEYIDSALGKQYENIHWSAEVGTWVVEAMDLRRAGMPREAFSLVFDGNPCPEYASKLFQRVQVDAAWQEAFDEACARRLFPLPSLGLKRIRGFYIREHFPKILRDMTNSERFFIRCNFDIGSSRDIEPIISQNRTRSPCTWESFWKAETSDFDWTFMRKAGEALPLLNKASYNSFVEAHIHPTERWRYAEEHVHDLESAFMEIPHRKTNCTFL
ncbi:hypothetical protein F5Y07DRAFT_350463 [Xylaria sp. FL0933]|nr:hypothetical protein F5Y07DRAFT_350463 [Xylaria sp. FL0933]